MPEFTMDLPIASGMASHEEILDQAIKDHQAGRIEMAEASYRRILIRNPLQPDALHLLAILACDSDDPCEALDRVCAALRQASDRGAVHNTRARALMMFGDLAEAEAAFRIAWRLRPDAAEIANNLGCSLRDRGNFDGAIKWFSQAARLAPTSGDIAANLADLLATMGAQAASLSMFRRAVTLCPDAAEIQYKFGQWLLSLDRHVEAWQYCRTAVQLRPDHASSLNNLGVILQQQGRAKEATQYFRRALDHDSRCADALYNLGCMLLLENRIDDARDWHDRAIEAHPLHGRALWARCMVELSVIYDTSAQILRQRRLYRRQLKALSSHANNPEVAHSLASAAGASQPFFLPYQGRCDRTLQTIYGALVARVMCVGTLQLADHPGRSEVIRIGVVSGFFCEHTIWWLILKGWLTQLDRVRFSIYAYHTARSDDDQTGVARRLCTRFLSGGHEDIRAGILADQPHVLLYPELGMDMVAARLAGERLAPLQCVSWGHPETSGLPTMDFFLSSALMEPVNASHHYSERLVTLPNLGIHYTPDDREAENCSRSTLGFRDGAIIFWCGQALYKYLPKYDEVFARIASEVSDCQFMFISFPKSQTVTECFRSRLRRAFSEKCLDADRYCLFVEPMSQERFLGTIRLADIVLDSIGWSGGKSTLDALAEAPVIVAHAGALMRGRHTAAILKIVGVTETIASTVDHYVRIAVRLARDPAERSVLRARLIAGRHRAMGDTAPIRALEAFLTDAVGQSSANPIPSEVNSSKILKRPRSRTALLARKCTALRLASMGLLTEG